MPRKRRFVPSREEGTLVEIFSKTLHSTHLLTPTADFIDTAAGVLGRSLEIAPVELCGISMLSNHHLCPAGHKKCYGQPLVMWSRLPVST